MLGPPSVETTQEQAALPYFLFFSSKTLPAILPSSIPNKSPTSTFIPVWLSIADFVWDSIHGINKSSLSSLPFPFPLPFPFFVGFLCTLFHGLDIAASSILAFATSMTLGLCATAALVTIGSSEGGQVSSSEAAEPGGLPPLQPPAPAKLTAAPRITTLRAIVAVAGRPFLPEAAGAGVVTGGAGACRFSAAQDFLVGLGPLVENNGAGKGALVMIVNLTSPNPLLAHFEPLRPRGASSLRSRKIGGAAGAGRSGYFA